MENNNNKQNIFSKISSLFKNNNSQEYFNDIKQPEQEIEKSNNSAWMSPGDTPKPIAQEEEGRNFDFPVYVNHSTAPKTGEGDKFEDLRWLAYNCDLLRSVIETRKDQVSRFSWNFVIKNNDKKTTDRRTKQLDDFFKSPDKEHNFHDWLRPLLEDLFVIDAPSIYVRRTKGGQIYSMEVIDGATIKRVIDHTGRTPIDGPAYQQYFKGIPAVDYTKKDLIYKPRNRLSNKIYGYSPVEQISNSVNLAIRKQNESLNYYKDGNTPNLIITAPEEYNADGIRKLQKFIDYITTGASKSKAKVLPHGITTINTHPEALKNDLDEWLARIICNAFSIAPTPYVKDNNRATSETTAKLAKEEGLLSILDWVKRLFDSIVFEYFGYDDIEFKWIFEEDHDPKILADINNSYIASGVLKINEVRQVLGYEPLPEVDNTSNNSDETQTNQIDGKNTTVI